MKNSKTIFGLATLLVAAIMFATAGPSMALIDKHQPKSHSKKTVKAASVVKYKAHCGMIYSAADAKKNHYICPMDHKPLTKIVVKK